VSAVTLEPSDLDEAIADAEDALSVLFSRVRLVYKEAAAQIHPDLSPVGYKVLSSVVRLGETNASALADALETDKAVVSRQVRMLEDAAFLTSRADERDGRARVLSATPAAIELVRSARATQQARLRELLSTRPEHEVRVFADVLRLIAQ